MIASAVLGQALQAPCGSVLRLWRIVALQLAQTGAQLFQILNGLLELQRQVVPGDLKIAPGRLNAQSTGQAQPLIIVSAFGAVLPQKSSQNAEKGIDVGQRGLDPSLQLVDMPVQHSPVLRWNPAAAAVQHITQEAGVAAHAHRARQFIEHSLQGPLIGLEAQLAGDCGFQMVGFVHNQVAVLGQDPVIDGHIGKQ